MHSKIKTSTELPQTMGSTLNKRVTTGEPRYFENITASCRKFGQLVENDE